MKRFFKMVLVVAVLWAVVSAVWSELSSHIAQSAIGRVQAH